MSIFSKLKSDVKSQLAAIGLYDANKLTSSELASAKSKNILVKKTLTPIVEGLGAAAGAVGLIGGGIAVLPTPISKLAGTGLALSGAAASTYVYGVTREPEATAKVIDTLGKGAKGYGQAYADDPLKTTLFTLAGAGGIFGLTKGLKPILTYGASKAGTKSALDDLGFSSANNLPPLSPQDSPTATPKGKKDKNASPIPRGEELINPPASPLDANMGATVPTEGSTTKAKTRRRSVRHKPQDINIRNTVKVYNDIYN